MNEQTNEINKRHKQTKQTNETNKQNKLNKQTKETNETNRRYKQTKQTNETSKRNKQTKQTDDTNKLNKQSKQTKRSIFSIKFIYFLRRCLLGLRIVQPTSEYILFNFSNRRMHHAPLSSLILSLPNKNTGFPVLRQTMMRKRSTRETDRQRETRQTDRADKQTDK